MKHMCAVTVLDKKVYPEPQEKHLADPEGGAIMRGWTLRRLRVAWRA